MTTTSNAAPRHVRALAATALAPMTTLFVRMNPIWDKAMPTEFARPLLGEFEHQVMVAVRNCGEDAYGLRIAEGLLEVYGGSLAIAQVYVTLNRLEKKGFLSSQMQAPRPIRGGRARRVFKLEGKGDLALEQSTAFRRALVTSADANGVAGETNETRHSQSGGNRAILTPAG
jgi:PadR family transcriptional regulator PadR